MFSIQVGASLIRFIKGKGYDILQGISFRLKIYVLCTYFITLPIRGSTQKNIEEEMGVTIIFPSSKKEDSIGMLFGVLN